MSSIRCPRCHGIFSAEEYKNHSCSGSGDTGYRDGFFKEKVGGTGGGQPPN